MPDPQIRVRSWVRGSAEDVRSGLLGWISIEVADLLVDGIALRKTTSGRLALSFPSRTARDGRRHPLVRPLDDQARREIEHEILGQLGQREEFQP